MPIKGILHMVVALQTLLDKPPLVNMAATWEPESRKRTP